MTITRRALCGSLATLTAAAVVAPVRGVATRDGKTALPDKANFPLDPPGATGVDYTLGSATAARFEVSTPSWEALAVAEQSLAYLHPGHERVFR